MRYNQIFWRIQELIFLATIKILSLQFTGGIYVIGSDQVYYQVLLFYIYILFFPKIFSKGVTTSWNFYNAPRLFAAMGARGGEETSWRPLSGQHWQLINWLHFLEDSNCLIIYMGVSGFWLYGYRICILFYM